jgi:hypothetical protein
MIYCVVPQALVSELYDKLVEHYRGDENVTVIVDRRKSERRARGGTAPADSAREIRDRRRARVPGEFSTLAE